MTKPQDVGWPLIADDGYRAERPCATKEDTMLYRSKPQDVEAVQWTGDNAEEVGRIAPYKFSTDIDEGPVRAWLRAGQDGAQGHVPVPVGHWVVRKPGDVTDLWPVDADYFAAKYEPVGS